MGKEDRLFRRMQRTRSGWDQDDFRALYEGFGFERREGGSHTIYIHPDHPDLRATVGRHNDLARGYADQAVALIGELLRRQEAAAQGVTGQPDGAGGEATNDD